jgi:hypothetical protein
METAKKGGSERKGIESQTKRLKVNGHQMRLFQCCLNGFDTPQPIGSPLINLTVMIM